MARERIANYVLFERTGSNAFGDRYRAGEVDGGTIRRHVHLYLLNGSCVEEEALWELIADRTELAGVLDDPHLGKCLAFGRHGAAPFLAYAFDSGRPLSQFLAALKTQKLPVSLDQSLFIIERAALGLTAAYGVQFCGRPVLHGFLIPDLVYLSGEGETRVLGTEAAPGLRRQLATHPAFSHYVAPEVRRGEPSAETDDVYSLGAILFHLLCGQPPPAAESSRIQESIETARLAAGGDRLPAVVTNLLKNSLAPKSNRIPDAATWQQVVGKIILDGEYNPTTFNLSFLMHTVFRRELDSELAIVAQELRQHISPEAPPEPAVPSGLSADPELPLPSIIGDSASAEPARRPFLAGFLISFLGATVLLTLYFIFFRSPSAAALEQRRRVVSAAEVVEEMTAPGSPLVLPEEPLEGEAPETDDSLQDLLPDDAPEVEPSENPIAELPEEELQRLLEERTENLEASLRAEYEARLRELEGRLEVANEAAVEESQPRPGPPATESGSSTPGRRATGSAPGAGSPTEIAALSTSPGDPARRPVAREPDDLPPGNQATDATVSPPTGDPEGTGSDDHGTGANREETASVSIVVTPPELQDPPRPDYPPAARRLRQSARVTVRVLVDEEGRVEEATLLGAEVGFGFDRAALEAARRSRWTPATRNGVPIESWAQLTIDFRP